MAEVIEIRKQASEAEARAQALDPQQSLLVQAPAGSGKTELLTQRFLALLAQVDAPEEIVAITFTRDATAEMKGRILKALDPDMQSTVQPKTRELAEAFLKKDGERAVPWNLCDHPQRLRVETIDSLCLGIASELPLLSRMGPAFQPIDDARTYYNIAASRTLGELRWLNADNASDRDRDVARSIRTLLRHRDNNLEDSTGLIAQMLAQRDQWLRHMSIDQESLTRESFHVDLRRRLETTLASIVTERCNAAHSLLCEHFRHLLPDLLHLLREVASNDEAPEAIRACAGIQVFDQHHHWLGFCDLFLKKDDEWRATVDKRQGISPEPAHAELKRQWGRLAVALKAVPSLQEHLWEVRSLPDSRYTDEEWEVIQALFYVLQEAIVQLKRIFAESGTVDFVEVNIAAQQALQSEDGPTDLALFVGSKIRHLLVDEFQDISLTQGRLIEYLTAAWGDDDLVRTLFVVGDPMQSIYMFRQAEVRLFARAKDRGIGDIALTPLHLKTNYRSQSALVQANNDLFQSVFTGIEIPFEPSTAARTASSASASVWHLQRFLPEQKSQQQTAQADDAARILRDVFLANRALPKENRKRAALLLRKKIDGASVLESLKRQSIPFRAVELDRLHQRQEVLDVVALTRALLHPADRIAWLSILRAPWCALTRAELEIVCGSDPYACIPDLLSSTIPLLSENARSNVERVQNAMLGAAPLRNIVSLPQLVDRVWRQLGGDVCVDDEQNQNVTAYLKMLAAMEAEQLIIDAKLIEQRLDQLWAEPNPLADGSITVMTIHKAKGLDFDVVVVPSLEGKPASDEALLLDWMEQTRDPDGSTAAENTAELLLAPIERKTSIRGSKGASKLTKYIRRDRSQRSREEIRRLLYVAATRAKEQVHFFAALEEGKSPDSNSLLAAAWPHVENMFPAAPERAPGIIQEIAAVGFQELLQFPEATKCQQIRRIKPDWSRPNAPPPLLVARGGWNQSPEDSGDIAERLEGDFEAASGPTGDLLVRAIGVATHLFLEHLAAQAPADQDSFCASLTPRIRTVLRSLAVSPDVLDASAARVATMMRTTLESAAGRWILYPHAEAKSEYPLTIVEHGHIQDLRLDRIFLAGERLYETGSTCRWIIDYKTTELGGKKLESFVDEQRTVYQPQLTAYAKALASQMSDQLPVRCALFYPAFGKLVEV